MKKLLIALLLTTSFTASAEVTIEDFMSSDQNSKLTYMAGVRDGLIYGDLICTGNVTVTQMLAMFQKFMIDNPKHWNKDTRHFIPAYLKVTFPCEAAKTETKPQAKMGYKF